MQGLPVVQAPGEGEAMCAALNEAGLVHACATCDGDVLLFGARTTFHTLKLQVRLRCCMLVCYNFCGVPRCNTRGHTTSQHGFEVEQSCVRQTGM